MLINRTIGYAASNLAVGMMLVGCTQSAVGRPAAYATRSADASKSAQAKFEKAQALAAKQSFASAIGPAEDAVALAPRDVAYRTLLADLYLKEGRFTSAEATFKDVLELNPGNRRAALNLALVQTALGKRAAAVGQLDSVADSAAPGDVGLAYALAGQPLRGVELLEVAARAEGATSRVRQNLALAYALAGEWKKARITAEQDLSPAMVTARLEQWAAFAQPSDPSAQVAALIGVKPVADAGQPTRLALAPISSPSASEPVAVAAAEPVVEPVPDFPQQIEVAAAEPIVPDEEIPAIRIETASADSEIQPTYVTAVQSLVESPVVRTADIKVGEPVRPFRPAYRAPARTGGRFVVQLGAFSTPGAVEKAWAGVYRRYAAVADSIPVSTTIQIDGRVLHRLSVSGFGNRSAASRVCQSVKAEGGACFVREVAGDAPVQWASRYARNA